MKPNFALNLSHNGISLFHREKDGWAIVGSVPLDDSNFGLKLRELRQRAQTLGNGEVTTKLVIPNPQILFSTVDAPGPSDVERRAQIRTALQGTTPYEIYDLAYDWSEENGTVFVATVARSTLDEAEAFAVDNGFNPLSLVAAPTDGYFIGEPFFGATKASKALLKSGESVERDGVPLYIPSQETEPEKTGDEKETKVGDTEDEAEEIIAKPSPPAKNTDSITSAKIPETGASVPKPATPAFSSRRSGEKSASKPDETLSRIGKTQSRLAILPEGNTSRSPELGSMQRKPVVGKAAIPKKSQPAHSTTVVKSPNPKVVVSATKATTPAPARPLLDEKQAMTVFGARRKPDQNITGSNAGLILTIAAALAVVGVLSFFIKDNVMALFSGKDGDLAAAIETTYIPSTDQESDRQIEDALALLSNPTIQHPAVTQTSIEPPAEQVVEPVNQPEPVAEPDPVTAPEPEPDQIATPETTQDPETTQSANAGSDVWQFAPNAPALPHAGKVAPHYIISADHGVSSHDAVGLPLLTNLGSDQSLTRQTTPAAYNTEYELDDRGLVIPSAEGTMNPDGVLVFAGPPPKKPDPRPNREPEAADPDVGIEPDSALAGFRPAPRPETQTEVSQTQQPAAQPHPELAEFRPSPRPALQKPEISTPEDPAQGTQPEETSDETPTAQAVLLSKLPNHRPRNFKRIVAHARASAPSERATAATAVPSNQTVAPSAPSRASVARLATTKNAINLRRTSLIGVYGSPSKRRALVRLSNGRYVKVQVGQRVDGGKVAAIGESDLRYVKGGRTIVLRMPKN